MDGYKLSDSAHPAVMELAEELDIPFVYAVGILECLRLWCADYIPKGNIGKYSNHVIARHGVGWTEADPDKLISALCKTGWLAEDSTHRLVIRHLNWRGGAKYMRWQRMKAAGGELARSIRSSIFSRDRFQCVLCGDYSDLTIDHILPISGGGTNAIENLRTLCRRCNSRKGDRF